MAGNVKHILPAPQLQFFPFKALVLQHWKEVGFVVLFLSFIAYGVGLTFLIEGQECFLKFGICVRPLAHIVDTNTEGREEAGREQPSGEGGGYCDSGVDGGKVDGEVVRFHNWHVDTKETQDKKYIK